MKNGVISMVLLVTLCAVLINLAQGLECYYCVSNNHQNPGSDPKTPPAHDTCDRNGYDLPSNLTITCTEENSNDFLKVTGSGEGWEGDFACITRHVPTTVGLDKSSPLERNETHTLAIIRSCILSSDSLPNGCKNKLWKRSNDSPNVNQVESCYCAEDKCNLHMPRIENIETTTEGRKEVTHEMSAVGDGARPQLTLISLSVAALLRPSTAF